MQRQIKSSILKNQVYWNSLGKALPQMCQHYINITPLKLQSRAAGNTVQTLNASHTFKSLTHSPLSACCQISTLLHPPTKLGSNQVTQPLLRLKMWHSKYDKTLKLEGGPHVINTPAFIC